LLLPKNQAEPVKHLGQFWISTPPLSGSVFGQRQHIEPLGEVGGELNIDPIKDLIPVCPNCHAMIHRQTPALKPDDLRALLQQAQK